MNLPNLRILRQFNFLFGFSLFSPLAVIYYAQVSGSYTLGTSIFGLITLSTAVFEVPTGVLSDRIGRKQIIIFGSITRVIAYMAYALGFSYLWLVIGALFEGLAHALFSGNNDAFLYDTLADHQLTNRYDEFRGKIASAEQLAMGISAILSSLIAFVSFHYLLWFTVIIQLGSIYLSLKLSEPHTRSLGQENPFNHLKEALRLFIINKKLRLLSLASIINYSISELKWEFQSTFIASVWPMWAVGIARTLPSFGASLSFYFSGKLIRRFKANTILLFDNIYSKVIGLISLIFPSVLSPLFMSTTSLLFGVSDVAENTLMQREFTSKQRATMSSLNSLGGSLGFFMMSLVLGGLADALGPTKALIALTLLGTPVIYLYWLLFKNHHQIITEKIN